MRTAPRAEAWAPGRCTLAGEHVDYAGGVVVCAALDLGVGVVVRPSHDGVFRAVSGERRAERAGAEPRGDIGDRIFAAVIALRDAGIDVPALEVEVQATLPEAAGLASSAAVTCATMAAALRLCGRTLATRAFIDTALHGERDIAGVPCGPLDPAAIVGSPGAAVLRLDCETLATRALRWPWDNVTLCVCATSERHDVGGAAYRARRAETEEALRSAGARTAKDLVEDDSNLAALPPLLQRRARHVTTETRRALAAAEALGRGDAAALGRVMSESHASLRDDHEVSTGLLDAVAAAAESCSGCLGARLVGAGFGGSVIALVRRDAAGACASAMAAAAGRGCRTWLVTPSPGLADTARDCISDG